MPVYLKYGDVKGEVKEPAHRSWIELMSAQLGTGRGVTPSGREGQSPSVSDIVVTKKLDSASSALFTESIQGQGVNAVIDFIREGGGTLLRLEMSGTMIAGYSISGSGGRSTESLTLNFSKITFTQVPGTPPP